MFENKKNLVSGGKIFDFFSTLEFLRFNGNSGDLFFSGSPLVHGFDRENLLFTDQIKLNLRWLFSLDALKVEFAGGGASKFFKSLNFFFTTQSRVWNQYYGGRAFFLRRQVRVQVFSNFSPVGVFFKMGDVLPIGVRLCARTQVGPFWGAAAVFESRGNAASKYQIYRNPFFLKVAACTLFGCSNYLNVGFSDILRVQLMFNRNLTVFLAHTEFNLQITPVGIYSISRLVRNLSIPTCGVLIQITRTAVLWGRRSFCRRNHSGKMRSIFFFLTLVAGTKLGFLLGRWRYYFRWLRVRVEAKGKLVINHFLVMRFILLYALLLLKNLIFIPFNRVRPLSSSLLIKRACAVDLAGKKNISHVIYWGGVRVKNPDIDAVWSIFFFLRRKFWWSMKFRRAIVGRLYICKLLFNPIFMVLGAVRFSYFLLRVVFCTFVYKRLKLPGGYISMEALLNVVIDLFYTAGSSLELGSGLALFSKRILSETVSSSTFLKEVSAQSKIKLVSFYSFNNFSNYRSFAATLLLGNTALNWWGTRSALNRLFFHSLRINRANYLRVLRWFKVDSVFNALVIRGRGQFYNVTLIQSGGSSITDSNQHVSFGDSFYKLLFSARRVSTFYSRFAESEIFYSPSQGILHFVRAGVSRMQYNFFFLYSFADRKRNMNCFYKLGGASSSNSFRFASGLKRFDLSFFNNISSNMLTSFSDLSMLGSNNIVSNAKLSARFDVSKFFFLDEFFESSFFNSLSGDIVSLNVNFLHSAVSQSYILNTTCYWGRGLTGKCFENLIFLKVTKWLMVSTYFDNLYGNLRLRYLFFDL